ncbi:MAG: TatD family hydrolase [Holosporaceae bacterium]|jgi:TatD DNase family protein|nr:TatD family hydrolase [Holosporaceae bacterium]
MFFVDSHCHLSFSRFKNAFKNSENDFLDTYSVGMIIKRALAVNVKYMLVIGTELSDIEELRAITDKYPGIFRTIGIHPLEAAVHCQRYSCNEISRILEDNYQDSKTVGIGEIGFDYHYEKESQKQQDKLFNLQLDLAKKYNLPVSIHSREASDDIIAVLKSHPGVRGVIHCFSGEKHFAEEALDLGFYISISGVITYKSATELQNSLRYIPLNRLLIETDCPFLTPAPFRGKLNEPAFVIHVAEKISELLQVSKGKIATFSSQNFFNVFSKATPI